MTHMDSLYPGSTGRRFVAKTSDHADVDVWIKDMGDTIPGYTANKTRFEALTTYIRLTFPEPRGPEGQTIMENYIQVDRWKFGRSGDIRCFRLEQDRDALQSMDIDMSSLPADLFAALQ